MAGSKPAIFLLPMTKHALHPFRNTNTHETQGN